MDELLKIIAVGITIITGPCEVDTVAKYDYESDVITMCQSQNYDREHLVHEMGHRFWFIWLGNIQRGNFSKLHSYCSDVRCFAWEYGKINKEEDFATVFVLYWELKGNSIELVNNYALRTKLQYLDYIIKTVINSNKK